MKGSLLLFLILSATMARTQFAPAAGQAGSTAIHKDSAIIIGWANACVSQRGYLNIADTTIGYVDAGNDTVAIGPADNMIVSLGDQGSAILTFNPPITNGDGFDFAIFENSFSDEFLELAFVEVSSDGENYFQFPATSNQNDSVQFGPFDALGEASLINNLAGKYRANFGTPFDIEALEDDVLLDKLKITHVKIIDVVGSINPMFASFDINGNPINDVYPTPFPSGGFDLDAVGVMNQFDATPINNSVKFEALEIYPNPVSELNFLQIEIKNTINRIEVIAINGQQTTMYSLAQLRETELVDGLYIIRVLDNTGKWFQQKLLVN